MAANASPGNEPLLIADHPVIDMLNTVANVDGAPHDHWQGDEDVARWLARTGWIASPAEAAFKDQALLRAARGLREAVRELVRQRKAGRRGDPEPLNAYLRQAASHMELAWNKAAAPQLHRLYGQRTPEALLGPLAEASALLLVEGDFDLVRQCEHPDCTLWFYDRTKSHKRRWCSMALCGNRHKVAAFRKRQAG